MVDEDRRRRLRALEERIKDPRSITNIDCLLDTVQALVLDCDHASVKRMKNIEAYMNRCKYCFLTFNTNLIFINHLLFQARCVMYQEVKNIYLCLCR